MLLVMFANGSDVATIQRMGYTSVDLLSYIHVWRKILSEEVSVSFDQLDGVSYQVKISHKGFIKLGSVIHVVV